MKNLNASGAQRFLAFIIDVSIIIVLSSLTVNLIYKLANYDTNQLDVLLSILTQKLESYSGNSKELFNALYDFLALYFKESVVLFSVRFVYSAIYLVIFPTFFKFQTLGRLASRTRVFKSNNEKATISNYAVRELIGTSIVISSFPLLIASAIISVKKGRSLSDYMSKTKLIDIRRYELYKSFNIIDAEVKEVKDSEGKIKIYTDDEILNEERND